MKWPKIRLVRGNQPQERQISTEQWAMMFQGIAYQIQGYGNGTLTQKSEEIGADFAGYMNNAYKANGIVFACVLARMSLFSEARFQFRRIRSGRPGQLFGTPALSLLEQP